MNDNIKVIYNSYLIRLAEGKESHINWKNRRRQIFIVNYTKGGTGDRRRV